MHFCTFQKEVKKRHGHKYSKTCFPDTKKGDSQKIQDRYLQQQV